MPATHRRDGHLSGRPEDSSACRFRCCCFGSGSRHRRPPRISGSSCMVCFPSTRVASRSLLRQVNSVPIRAESRAQRGRRREQGERFSCEVLPFGPAGCGHDAECRNCFESSVTHITGAATRVTLVEPVYCEHRRRPLLPRAGRSRRLSASLPLIARADTRSNALRTQSLALPDGQNTP